MNIECIKLTNFKCFKDTTDINLSDLTAFIGSNGTGKTAILLALARLFGSESSLRKIESTDFYINTNEKLEDEAERSLSIEIKLSFPELEHASGTTSAVARYFNHMIISSPGEAPYCRMVLEAKWYNSSTSGGDIEQNLYWITTDSETATDEYRQKVKPLERSKIQVHYIPASRNPSKHIKYAAGSIMHQLLKSIKWGDNIHQEYQRVAEEMKGFFQSENGIATIQDSLSKQWKSLFNSELYKNVNITPVSSDFENFLSKIDVTFDPNPSGNEEGGKVE